MKKHITKYYESDGLITCTFEILDIENDGLVNLFIHKIKREYKERWIKMLLIKGRNIKCQLWLSSIDCGDGEIKEFKKNVIRDLMNKEFIWSQETIKGDGN
jgi:hypothetical protein